MSNILNYVGININTVPVLDVRRDSSHDIIGDRSFSNNQNVVSAIGKVCINLYKKNKILPIKKAFSFCIFDMKKNYSFLKYF